MGRIIAIGGGDLTTTRPLNKYAIKLSGKKEPNLLFVGTASGDASGYIDSIRNAFEQLNCKVKDLSLTKKEYTDAQIDELLGEADIIYVGGGDTNTMMQVWKQYYIDQKLLAIYEKDEAVLMGLSAGAICWFDCGHSDCESFLGKEDWKYMFVEGMLGIHHYALCPHYNEEGRESFDEMMKEKHLPGIALENDTAFIEENGNQYFLRTREDAKAYRIQYLDGKLEKNMVF